MISRIEYSEMFDIVMKLFVLYKTEHNENEKTPYLIVVNLQKH